MLRFRIEFLHISVTPGPFRKRRLLTLQKSMLFTPLLPKAGPTGGLGLACPAPTMSLTIWSLAGIFLAMLAVGI